MQPMSRRSTRDLADRPSQVILPRIAKGNRENLVLGMLLVCGSDLPRELLKNVGVPYFSSRWLLPCTCPCYLASP